MKHSLFTLTILSIVSCTKNSDKTTSLNLTSSAEYPTKHYVWPDTIQNIFLVPDSIGFWDVDTTENDGNWTVVKLWTPEQKALGQLIISTVFDNVKVRKNKLVLDINREDFVAQGIPEPYYDFFQERVNNLNTLEEKGINIKDTPMEEIWAETQRTISRVLFKG